MPTVASSPNANVTQRSPKGPANEPRVQLPVTNLTVMAYVPPPMQMAIALIENATGELIVVRAGDELRFRLTASGGTRPNALKAGQQIVATGVGPDGRQFKTPIMTTAGVGDPAEFTASIVSYSDGLGAGPGGTAQQG